MQVCAPVAASSAPEAVRWIRKAESLGADLIEIRLNYLKDPKEMEKIVGSTSLPMIATNRQHGQGGHRLQNEDQRVETLLDAANLGFQYVDLELTTAALEPVARQLRESGVSLIVSFHNFEQTPPIAEMEKIMRSQMKAGADICKLVTTANETADNVSCLLLTRKMSEDTKVVCFAMGKMGVISRALSPLFGAHFTYASIKKGRETAPGQLSIPELKRIYRSLGVEDWRSPEKPGFVP